MGECVRKEACPCGDSSDALQIYEDESGFCFKCDNYFSEEELTGQASPAKSKGASIVSTITPIQGDYIFLEARGIQADTCRKYGYRVGYYDGLPAQICDVKDLNGKLIGQKIRLKDKEFKTLGKGVVEALIGAHLFNGGKKIIITEGEIDMLTLSQVQGNKYPVVSLPNGVKSVKKAIGNSLQYLSNFEEVVLCFDMDEPGREAIAEAALMLMDHNVRVMNLPEKDPNEMLKKGLVQELVRAVWNAEPYRPDGLVTLDSLVEDVIKPVEVGLDWFLPTLTKHTYGRRPGEVYFFGAGTGMGKTDLFTQQMAFDVETLNKPVGVFYLEMGTVEAARRIAGKVAKKTFHIPDTGWTQEQLVETIQRPSLKNRVTLFDSFGVTEWDSIKQHIIYLASQGVKLFYIDHLTALATGSEKSEKEELERVTADMAMLAKRYGLILHVISHLTTPEHGSHEEGARVTIRQFKGSRAIGFWAHFMFGLERNQQAADEDERQTTTFRILKDRYTGRAAGVTIKLGYDFETGLLYEQETFTEPSISAEEEEPRYAF
ncbi:DnaB-like helicase C-terminal domain-containing protein [Microbulbifer sp. JMSA002]|uniref:DnaB-like helicase C-terminal domain-containing protein n=1 Tax=Microbulbifer sp. JMSA002 TaxID=3243368 RepID=UPI00403A589A